VGDLCNAFNLENKKPMLQCEPIMNWFRKMNDSALEAIRALIDTRGLKDGDMLPPERELSEALGLSRRALRDALGFMEGNAEIWRGVGRGTFLGTRPVKFGRGIEILTDNTSPADIAELRLALEPTIAELAAVKATAEDLEELDNCVRKHAATRDDETWRKWDHRFHYLIAKSTRNPAIIALVEAINVVRGRPGSRARLSDADMRRNYGLQHREVFDAIAARDPDRAREAMRSHLSQVQALLRG
jgi:GntR family transcriptional repressor for pyruvate dehydrogenase complex